MKTRQLGRFCLLIVVLLSPVLLSAESLPAFPGAEGGGKYTTGGRGGTVYYVTSLADTNTGNSSTREGTLRWCINQSGARTILFKVSGIINLSSRLDIKNGNLTIAGQTAPGDGICLKNNSVCVQADNVIIRYMRFRPGDSDPDFEDDAIWGRYRKNIIIDHCSMSFSVDECASFYANQNFTMQWCLLSESLNNSQHAKGAHGYGGLWGGENASFHHNLLAHHNSRNARLCGWQRSGLKYAHGNTAAETVDYRNNVVYNWGDNSTYGGEAAGQYNIVNNYYKAGPATASGVKYRLMQMDKDAQSFEISVGGTTRSINHGVYYMAGNYMYGSTAITRNNWDASGIKNNTGETLAQCRLNQPLDFEYIPTHTAEDAFEAVLAYAGASLARDAQDFRVAEEAANGTATYTGSVTARKGLIDTPSDVEGYCTYNSAAAPADTDRDGIPDELEELFGTDPNVYDSHQKDASGYTFLELYLAWIVRDITAEQYANVISAVVAPSVDGPVLPEVWFEGERMHVRSSRSLSQVTVWSVSGQLLGRIPLRGLTENAVDFPWQGVFLVRFELPDGSSLQTKLLR